MIDMMRRYQLTPSLWFSFLLLADAIKIAKMRYAARPSRLLPPLCASAVFIYILSPPRHAFAFPHFSDMILYEHPFLRFSALSGRDDMILMILLLCLSRHQDAFMMFYIWYDDILPPRYMIKRSYAFYADAMRFFSAAAMRALYATPLLSSSFSAHFHCLLFFAFHILPEFLRLHGLRLLLPSPPSSAIYERALCFLHVAVFAAAAPSFAPSRFFTPALSCAHAREDILFLSPLKIYYICWRDALCAMPRATPFLLFIIYAHAALRGKRGCLLHNAIDSRRLW